MEHPKYIARKEGNPPNKSEYRIFEFKKGFYTRHCPVRGEMGYDLATFLDYQAGFMQADTLEEIQNKIKRAMHAEIHGSGVEGDFACPVCDYKYSPNYYDNNDGYYTPAIIEDYSTVVECICGCKFKASIKVKISFDVEKM